MNIALKPEYEQFVQAQIKSGRFTSIDEVIGHAFQLLENEQEYDPLWLEDTKQKIAIGLAQIENGQVLDGPSVIARLKAKVQRTRDAES
jgi:antitoxin ParD1/3/4